MLVRKEFITLDSVVPRLSALPQECRALGSFLATAPDLLAGVGTGHLNCHNSRLLQEHSDCKPRSCLWAVLPPSALPSLYSLALGSPALSRHPPLLSRIMLQSCLFSSRLLFQRFAGQLLTSQTLHAILALNRPCMPYCL